MTELCYLFAFIFEQSVSYIYFTNKCEKRLKTGYILMCYALSFAVQFSLNFLGMPILNLVAFFVCNLLVAVYCFDMNFKSTIFNVMLLLSLMFTTELAVMYSFSLINNSEIIDYESTLLFQTIATKSVYFMAVFLLSRFSIKTRKMVRANELPLLVLPVISVVSSHLFVTIISNYHLDRTVYISLVIMSFTMLFSTAFVFLLHEKIVQTIIENAEYALELQKIEIDNKYYSEIERQYEERSMLIHDIKKHMDIVSSLADDKDFAGIKKYIATVYDSNDVSSFKVFSRNRIVNVIVNRYNSLCKENGTEFNGDIRNVDFDFMAQSDITSLLTNLLENACESAKKSTQKKVDFLVENKHPFVTITLINSCDTKPTRKDDVYVTEKEDKFNHGYGTKIIRKISRRYHGKTTYEFDAANKKFTTTVVLRTDGKM